MPGNISQSELFGQPNDTTMRAVCGPCYRPDLGQKLWGFTAVNLNMTSIITGTHLSLSNLTSSGYVYSLYRPRNLSSNTPDALIGKTPGASMSLADMHMQVIDVPNSQVGLSQCG